MQTTKYRFGKVARIGQPTWIIIGMSPGGFLRDLAYSLYHCWLGDCVLAYVHNRSWQYYLMWRWPLRRLLGRKFRLVVLTKNIGTTLNDAGYRTHVLANTYSDASENYPSLNRRKRILWIGLTSEEKGFLIAYRAYQILRRADPEWIFDVYGNGPCYERREQFSDAVFHGAVQGDAKVQAFSAGGIFILPTRYRNETQPMVIVEAMHFGLPTVASDQGGIREMIEDEARGGGICLPPDASPEDYASACRKIYDDYANFSNNARRLFLQRFDPERFRQSLVSLMAEVGGGQ